MSKLSNNATQNLLKELNTHTEHHTTTHSKLDTIATNTANINLNVDTLEVNTDTLEALYTTGNGTLASILVDTDAIDSSCNTIEAQSVLTASRLNNIQNKISANVDGTGDTLGQINSNILTKNGEIESSLNSLISANHTDLEHVSDNLDTIETTLTEIVGDTTSLDSKVVACNTGAVVISSSVLPTGASTEAKQDDIESSLNSLISANHTDLVALETTLTEIAVDGNNVQTKLDTIDGSINTIEACVGSNKVNVNISSGNISGFSTEAKQDDIESSLNSLITANHTDLEHISDNLDTLETTLTEIATDGNNIQTKLDTIDGSINTLEACVGSNKVNVNISSGSMSLASGASTEAKQDDIESSLNSLISANHTDLEHISDNLDTLETTLTEIAVDGNNIQTKLDTIDGSINTIEACVGSNKVNVNISSGNISGFATSALQGDIESSLNSLITANHTDFGTLDTTTQGVTDAVEAMDNKIVACNTGAVVISSGAVTATLSATDNAVLDAIDAVLDTIKVDTEAIETAVETLSANQSKSVTQLLYGTGNLVANGTPESSSNSVEMLNNGERVTTYIEAQNVSWDAFNEWSHDNSTWFTDTSLNFSGSQNIFYHDFKKGKYLRVKINNTTGTGGDTNSFIVNIVQ